MDKFKKDYLSDCWKEHLRKARKDERMEHRKVMRRLALNYSRNLALVASDTEMQSAGEKKSKRGSPRTRKGKRIYIEMPEVFESNIGYILCEAEGVAKWLKAMRPRNKTRIAEDIEDIRFMAEVTAMVLKLIHNQLGLLLRKESVGANGHESQSDVKT
jgi:hypothetical protein